MQISDEIIRGIITIVTSVIASSSVAFIAFKRLPFQNRKDESDALKTANELINSLGTSIKTENNELKQEIETLKQQINQMNGEYELRIMLTVGDKPNASVVSVTKYQHSDIMQ